MTGTLATFCVEMTGLPCNRDDSSGIAEEMPNTPSGLKLLSCYEVGSDCTSVIFDSRSGDLILGCTDGVKILRKGSHEAKAKTQHCNWSMNYIKPDALFGVGFVKTLMRVGCVDYLKII